MEATGLDESFPAPLPPRIVRVRRLLSALTRDLDKATAVVRERRTRVAGDVLVELWDYDLAGDDFMCKFWFNTLFIPKSNTLIFTKDQIDKANQDKKNQFFDQSFKVEITFADFTVSR